VARRLPTLSERPAGALTDSFGRRITDLRVSLTDRCNFRCVYCIPDEHNDWIPRHEILSYEEIERIVRAGVELGIEKVRLTGGEPLLRRDLPVLVEMLGRIPGIKDFALTTNAYFLPQSAADLARAGLRRITVSLDSIRTAKFALLTGRDALDKVLAGIDAPRAAGLQPIKVNCVVIRGFNDDEIVDFAAFAREHGLSVRFIEFMPLDGRSDWDRAQVVSGAEMLENIRARFDLVAVDPTTPSETARRYRFADGAPGEVGFITTITEPFCDGCSRLRLTADGRLRTCLFSKRSHDLKALVRAGAPTDAIKRFIVDTVLTKEATHGINVPGFTPSAETMSSIGG
jgi:cyclic pyranopterin phosphate synthase